MDSPRPKRLDLSHVPFQIALSYPIYLSALPERALFEFSHRAREAQVDDLKASSNANME